MRRALFSYNHANWYVEKVLSLAAMYRGEACAEGSAPAGAAGSPPGSRLERLLRAAEEIDRRRIPYYHGGGHGVTPAHPTRGRYCWHPGEHKVFGSPDSGLDCSSSLSLLLQSVGSFRRDAGPVHDLWASPAAAAG
jgi:hypothetical protein